MTSKTSNTKGEFLPKQGPHLSLRILGGWLRCRLPLTSRFHKCQQVRLAFDMFDCCFDVKSLKYIEKHRILPQELKSWPTIHFLKLSSLSMTWYPDVEVARDGKSPLWALGENETNCFHLLFWRYNMLPWKLKQNIKHDSIAWIWLWCHEMFVRKVGRRVEDGHVT